jgi:nucleoside-diphosphate-sugar epimerase/uncharacterized membrane protein YphA (DoxX/SURF4 family)
MNILIIGATGFVGSAVTQQLLTPEFTIYCAGRNCDLIQKKFPQAHPIYCDFFTDVDEEVWLPRLQDIDVVINCVGIFYHYDKRIMWRLHYETPVALFSAAKKAGVKQIIHLSALGIEEHHTTYSDSKKAAEDYLRNSSITHIIIKPSFIYGTGAKGGMFLLRGLAALPFILPIPGAGEQEFQPIYVEDLAYSIRNLVRLQPPSMTLAAVSDERIKIKDILSSLRQQMNLPKALMIKVPFFLIKLGAIFGNFFAYSPINTPAISMLKKGNTTSMEESLKFQQETSNIPRPFKEQIKKIPCSSSERWAAKSFFLRPLLRLSLSFTWLMAGITSILPMRKPISYALLSEMGIAGFIQPIVLYGASIINIILGFSLLINYKTKLNCGFQLFFILIYTLIITLGLPRLWLEPFGPVVKNIPLILTIILLYSMEEEHDLSVA